MKLNDKITELKGIGPRKAEALGKLGLFSVYDIIRHFPRKYQDYSVITPITAARHGDDAAVEVKLKTEPKLARVRGGLNIITAKAFDQSGEITLTWYNQPYMLRFAAEGECIIACGRVDRAKGARLVNPAIYRALPGILPVYPVCAGISQRLLRDAVHEALECCCDEITETLPESMRRRYGLVGLYDALFGIHFPGNMAKMKEARQRLAFEDTLLFSLMLSMMQQSLPKREKPLELEGSIERFIETLPFEPTGAQLRAMREIQRDLSGSRLMNRLLQGDVGSGKTAVALYAMYAAIQNGRQAALMAPTEILAAQHYSTLCKTFGAEKVAYLRGGMKKAEREAVLLRISRGEAMAITGTHALLQGDVRFFDLGMVVTDEQHRFGVAQRAAIGSKGGETDVLIMSATPIPRTLALILYGDLSVSCIDELPPGRMPVTTRLVPVHKREAMYKFIEKQAQAGRQAYVVCPLVESSESLDDVQSAVELYKELKRSMKVSVGLLHGQMSGQAKERAAAAFRCGDIAVLVATTVIEVGVDVSNATVMAIENSDRFGLAQLHQLRGRVGRGDKESFCFLLGSGGEAAQQRLSTLVKTNDGFEIAETDLMMRGPGEFLGKRQHGLSEFAAASLAMDISSMREAKEAAEEILSSREAMAEAAPLVRRAWSRLEALNGDIARN